MKRWRIVTPFAARSDSRAERLARELERQGVVVEVCGLPPEVAAERARGRRRALGYREAWRRSRGIDVVVTVNAEYTLIATIGRLLRGDKSQRIVADIYDHHGYIFKGVIARLFSVLEQCALRCADRAIIPIEARLDQYRPKLPEAVRQRVIFVSNLGFGAPFERTNGAQEIGKSVHVAEGRSPKRPLLVYAGTVDYGRGLVEMVSAGRRYPDLVEVCIHGTGPLVRNPVFVAEAGAMMRGGFSANQLPELYSSATAILACYELSVPNHAYCDPNKLREVFEFRVPLITNAGTPLASEVKRMNVGVVLDVLTPETLVSAVVQIAADRSKWMERIEKALPTFAQKVEENRLQVARLISEVSV